MKLDEFFSIQPTVAGVAHPHGKRGAAPPPVTSGVLDAELQIRWTGEVTALNAVELGAHTESELSQAVAGMNVVIDLSRVTFVDSTGIGLMVRFKKNLKRRDINLKFAARHRARPQCRPPDPTGGISLPLTEAASFSPATANKSSLHFAARSRINLPCSHGFFPPPSTALTPTRSKSRSTAAMATLHRTRRPARRGGQGIQGPRLHRARQFRLQISDGQNHHQPRARRREKRRAEF